VKGMQGLHISGTPVQRLAISMIMTVLAGTPLWLQAAGAPAQLPAPSQRPVDNLVDPNAEPQQALAPAPAPQVDLALMEQGQKTFKAYCQRCHGIDMVSPGAGFFDLRKFPRDDKARFIQSVTNGKRAMPAWSGVLQASDLEALWSYVAGSQVSQYATRPGNGGGQR
jgi:mono/diheme cytochrome c family protein